MVLNVGDLVIWIGGQLSAVYGEKNLAVVVETDLPSEHPRHVGLTQVRIKWLAGYREGHHEQAWTHDLDLVTPRSDSENLD